MTKKMIDVDAVDRLLVGIMKRGLYNIMGVEYSIDVAVLQNIKHKINELATPTPVEAIELSQVNRIIDEFGDDLDGKILTLINRNAEELHGEIYDAIHNQMQKRKDKLKKNTLLPTGGNHE